MTGFSKRIIPMLQLSAGSLVKTKKFDNFDYIGDPINTIRIFNELGVDEISLTCIDFWKKKNLNLPWNVLEAIAKECFVPLSYGGGIYSIEDAERIFRCGYEKVVVNSLLEENPKKVQNMIREFGAQSIVGKIDITKNLLGNFVVLNKHRKIKNIENYIKRVVDLGIGELILCDQSSEGTWNGFNYNLFSFLGSNIDIPLVITGGCKSKKDAENMLSKPYCDAIGLGNLICYKAPNQGVLVNYPWRGLN